MLDVKGFREFVFVGLSLALVAGVATTALNNLVSPPTEQTANCSR
ncbi:MAG: hypothetical protein PUP93_30500 [Rhizonema sp. NSF051]|nr:hypothetical protein [Rhizonema sp. NSF051]